MSWPYLYPTLQEMWQGVGLVGDRQQPLVSWDLEGALHVGIYCAEESHEDKPWAIGLFTPNLDYYRMTKTVWWSFHEEYISGDGYVISLPNSKRSTLLVGDKPYDTQGDSLLLQSSKARSEGRGRPSLECGICGLRASLRSESVQLPVLEFAKCGIREIKLSLLVAAVGRTK